MHSDSVSPGVAIEEATRYVKSRWDSTPRVGIILGSGLGNLATAVEQPCAVPYEETPHFPQSTAIGHHGQFVCGELGGVKVIVMQGRFHLYEGYSTKNVTLPVHVMCRLGIDTLIVSNAAGGLNPGFSAGDVMVINGHLNRMHRRPEYGIPNTAPTIWAQSTLRPYHPELQSMARHIARQNDFEAPLGVYAGHLGPNYETRAEYRYLRKLGADAVGMSTIPEVLVAESYDVRTLAFSAITNVCRPDALTETTAEEVIEIAAIAGQKIKKILLGILNFYAQSGREISK